MSKPLNLANSQDFVLPEENVAFWHLDLIDVTRPLKDQRLNFDEDMVWIEITKSIGVDVGWYRPPGQTGIFRVRVIRDNQWKEPVFRADCPTLHTLTASLLEALQVARDLKR